MQRILIFLLSIITAAGVFLALRYRGQLDAQNIQIASLTAERDTALADKKEALSKVDLLNENTERLQRERDRLLAKMKEPRPPGPPTNGGPPGAGGPEGGMPSIAGLAAMFQTPDGKAMMRNQATQMVRTQYNDLVKRMKLSPADSTVLLGLLADRQTALMSARFSAGGSSAQAAAQVSAIESEFNDKLKSTLGEQGFNEFSGYEETVQERTELNQFADQFSSAGTPLDSSQKESLVQLMATERKNSPENPFNPEKNDPNTVYNLLKDDTTFSTWEKQQQDYQSRVLQSAAKTLSPDQVNTLKQVLDQKTQQDKAALQMFKATGTPPPNPPPPR